MIHVIVTTEYRGVFYGQIDPEDFNKTEIILHGAKNVMYWASKTRGFLGLSMDGPNSDCKIGREAGGPMMVHKVTSITTCSEKAIEAWEQY